MPEIVNLKGNRMIYGVLVIKQLIKMSLNAFGYNVVKLSKKQHISTFDEIHSKLVRDNVSESKPCYFRCWCT